jgi:hypothetical protein
MNFGELVASMAAHGRSRRLPPHPRGLVRPQFQRFRVATRPRLQPLCCALRVLLSAGAPKRAWSHTRHSLGQHGKMLRDHGIEQYQGQARVAGRACACNCSTKVTMCRVAWAHIPMRGCSFLHFNTKQREKKLDRCQLVCMHTGEASPRGLHSIPYVGGQDCSWGGSQGSDSTEEERTRARTGNDEKQQQQQQHFFHHCCCCLHAVCDKYVYSICSATTPTNQGKPAVLQASSHLSSSLRAKTLIYATRT